MMLCCFVPIKQQAQNLVPNPSFEQHTDCINNGISNTVPWNTICNGSAGGCSFLHPCKLDPYTQVPFQFYDACLQSYQVPHSGLAYIEFGSFVMSSIQQENNTPFVKLIDTLKVGKNYCVTYYVSMWNNARYSIDKLGALFTYTAFPIRMPIACNSSNTVSVVGLYTPQVITPAGVVFEDTLNWMEVSGSFIANGNEVYLSLGDFFKQSQHFIKDSYPTNCNGLAEYYVDDVSVEEVQLAMCKNDTSICPTDSVLLGNNISEATSYTWLPNIGLSCNTCANPKASPNRTTTYTLTKTQCKAVTKASITVTVKTDCTPKVTISEIPNVFTPNGDGINDTFNFSIVGASNVSFTIYNRWGNIVKNSTLATHTYISWDGRTTSGEACSEGIYFYTLQYTDAKGDTQKKNGYVSLFR